MANRRNEEQHARKVDHIATFCAGILAAEGPTALEPNQIGRRIDGSGYNVNNLYGNRGLLLALVLDRHMNGLLAAAVTMHDWAGTPRERLLAMARSYLARVAAARGVHASLARSYFFLLPATRDAYDQRRLWLADAFAEALAAVRPDLAEDPAECAALSEALLDALDGWATRPRDGRPDDATFAEMLVRRMCGAPEGAAPDV